jgi:TPR repeat protein
MSKLFWGLLCLVGTCFSGAVRANEIDQGLATLWEVLWHQSGTPTRVVRWEDDIKVRIHGVNAAAHKQYTLAALRTVTAEAGLKLIDVSDLPHAEEVSNLDIEIVPDNKLEDNQPCATYLDFKAENRIESATIQMRGRDAWRCTYHEAMHAMGLRGHPAGKTVLSYFPWRVDGLLPLDRVMLRAWYSRRMTGGMTPFEALPVLADELVASSPDKAAAEQARNRFFATTISQMQAYAAGTGDIPVVVKRSGKSTDEGVRQGRTEMCYFLGVAFQIGATAPQDSTKAVQWLERAASAGNRGAQALLGSFR